MNKLNKIQFILKLATTNNYTAIALALTSAVSSTTTTTTVTTTSTSMNNITELNARLLNGI